VTVVQISLFGNTKTSTKTIKVDVQPPTNVMFKDTYGPNVFQSTDAYNPGTNSVGFSQLVVKDVNNQRTITPGDVFTATVDTPANPRNAGTNFAVLQLVNSMDNQTTLHSGKVIPLKNDPPASLDSPKGAPNDYLNGLIMGPIASGLVGVRLPQDAGQDPAALDDSPALIYPSGIYIQNGGDYAVSFKQQADFTTHLMYQAQRGLWVSISSISWSITGQAVLKPEANPAGLSTIAYYTDPNNWTIQNATPNQAGVYIGKNAFIQPNWRGRAQK